MRTIADRNGQLLVCWQIYSILAVWGILFIVDFHDNTDSIMGWKYLFLGALLIALAQSWMNLTMMKETKEFEFKKVAQ